MGTKTRIGLFLMMGILVSLAAALDIQAAATLSAGTGQDGPTVQVTIPIHYTINPDPHKSAIAFDLTVDPL